MKLTFLGAAREVTGSCTLIEAGGHRFLVDCGMEQGKDVYPNADLPCAPGEIEAILLTHAHIDHSGRIPYLYKNGFRGPIYSTDATMDLCEIMLEDSAHIQEQEAEWKNRKAQRSGNELVEPDYTVEDAMAVMKQFVPQSYGKPLEVFPGITATFTDVGHLLGSASITLQVTENGESQTIVFSGDIGNLDQPLIRNPQYLTLSLIHISEPRKRSTAAAMWSFPVSPWVARRKCSILSARSKRSTASTGTITSPCLWTARWPANPPPFSGKTSVNVMTPKPSPW